MESVQQSIREFQTELDQRNALALQELNKQIDELAKIPIDEKLPPFVDSIELTSPPKAFAEISPTDHNVTFQLEQDLKEFRKISNQVDSSFQFDSQLDARIDSLLSDKSRVEITDRSLFLDTLDNDLVQKGVTSATTPYLTQDTIDLLQKYEKQSQPISNPILTQISAFAPSHVTDSPLFKPEVELPSSSKPESLPPRQYANYSAPVVEKTTGISRYDDSLLQSDLSHLNHGVAAPSNFQDHVHNLSYKLESLQKRSDLPSTLDRTEKPVQSDSRDIIDIIRTLQDRLGKLEGERDAAKVKIEGLEKELTTTRQLLFQQQHETKREVAPPAEPLPAVDAPSRTLESISQAKQGISNLKERVDRTLQLSEVGTQQIDREIDKNLNFSADVLKRAQQDMFHSSQRVQVDRYTSPMPPLLPVEREAPKFKAAWESQSESFSKSPAKDDPTAPKSEAISEFKSSRPKSPFRSSIERKRFWAEEEIANLKREIAQASQPTTSIKEKLVQRIKSEPALKKSKERKDPVWKKTERKAKSGPKESSTTHVRKKAPIEVPVVASSTEESGKREMPFIVGTVHEILT
jgi:predicted  nucleic acid-binding Zn-ribbon protein